MMKKRALCIGINAYGGGNDLEGCVNDAVDWGVVLRAHDYTVKTLCDGEATGEAIRTALASAAAATRFGDRLVVTYSGHGSFVDDASGDEPDRLDECWCAVDILSSPAGYVVDDQIAALLAARVAGSRAVVISDSCYSGSVARHFDLAPRGARKVRYLHPTAFLPADRAARLRAKPLRRGVSKRYPALLLSACQDDQFSYDAWFEGRANGAFTRVAIDALASSPILYRGWFEAIRRKLPSHDYPQTPNLCGGLWQRLWTVFG